MAEIEHIKMLCRGVDHWNRARAEDDFKPDLSKVEIRNANLAGVDFRGVEFNRVRFLNVEAKGSNFQNARLNGLRADRASFRGCNLNGAELKGADFESSSLSGSRMTGVATRKLKIVSSDLSGVQIEGTGLDSAHFFNCDFTGARFLNLDLSGLYLRRPILDQSLARKFDEAGAVFELANDPEEDEGIDWQNFSVDDAGEDFGSILYGDQLYIINEGRWDFFINHASVDKKALAAPLKKALDALGQRTWLDKDEVKLGDDLTTVLNRGTRGSLSGVIIASKNFFGRKWTEFEVKALKRKRLFLVRHGLSAEELAKKRPELADLVTIGSEEGPEKIARALVEAVQAPRSQEI